MASLTMRHSIVGIFSRNVFHSARRRRRRHANIDAATSRSFCGASISSTSRPWTTTSSCQNINVRGFPSASFSSDSRPDPFARRPTSKCDPYDQGGKPLTLDKVSALMATVEPEWEILMTENNDNDENENNDNDDDEPSSNHDSTTTTIIPFAIRRFYWHDEYLQGAEFMKHVAAVAQMNAQHFPHQLTLNRKLNSKSKTKTWTICTEVVCRTHVLQGLSGHDFYLATLIDIEATRPEVRGLLIT